MLDKRTDGGTHTDNHGENVSHDIPPADSDAAQDLPY
jgi:hypothetical protein